MIKMRKKGSYLIVILTTILIQVFAQDDSQEPMIGGQGFPTDPIDSEPNFDDQEPFADNPPMLCAPRYNQDSDCMNIRSIYQLDIWIDKHAGNMKEELNCHQLVYLSRISHESNNENLDFCYKYLFIDNQPKQTCCTSGMMSDIRTAINNQFRKLMSANSKTKFQALFEQINEVKESCSVSDEDFNNAKNSLLIDGVSQPMMPLQEIQNKFTSSYKQIVMKNFNYTLQNLCSLCIDPSEINKYFTGDNLKIQQSAFDIYYDSQQQGHEGIGQAFTKINEVKKHIQAFLPKLMEISDGNNLVNCVNARYNLQRQINERFYPICASKQTLKHFSDLGSCPDTISSPPLPPEQDGSDPTEPSEPPFVGGGYPPESSEPIEPPILGSGDPSQEPPEPPILGGSNPSGEPDQLSQQNDVQSLPPLPPDFEISQSSGSDTQNQFTGLPNNNEMIINACAQPGNDIFNPDDEQYQCTKANILQNNFFTLFGDELIEIFLQDPEYVMTSGVSGGSSGGSTGSGTVEPEPTLPPVVGSGNNDSTEEGVAEPDNPMVGSSQNGGTGEPESESSPIVGASGNSGETEPESSPILGSAPSRESSNQNNNQPDGGGRRLLQIEGEPTPVIFTSVQNEGFQYFEVVDEDINQHLNQEFDDSSQNLIDFTRTASQDEFIGIPYPASPNDPNQDGIPSNGENQALGAGAENDGSGNSLNDGSGNSLNEGSGNSLNNVSIGSRLAISLISLAFIIASFI